MPEGKHSEKLQESKQQDERSLGTWCHNDCHIIRSAHTALSQAEDWTLLLLSFWILPVIWPWKCCLNYMNVCMLSCFSHVRLFENPWTVACQAPLSMGLSRQEYWKGLPCPLQGIFPTQESNPCLKSPALSGKFFATRKTWEALLITYIYFINFSLSSFLLYPFRERLDWYPSGSSEHLD